MVSIALLLLSLSLVAAESTLPPLPRSLMPSIEALIGKEVVVSLYPLSSLAPTASSGDGSGSDSALPSFGSVPFESVAALQTAIDSHFTALRNLISAAVSSLSGRVAPASTAANSMKPFSIGPFSGYSGIFDRNILEFIRRQPVVLSIETNDPIHVMQPNSFLPFAPPFATRPESAAESSTAQPPSVDAAPALSSRPAFSWGIDRIDQRLLPLDGRYTYPPSAGDGVVVYSLDTGCNVEHEQFGGRARWGTVITAGASRRDVWGHGTHTAGVILADMYGVANKASLVADQGTGSVSDVVNGLQWILNDRKTAKDNRRANLINMSLGGGFSNALNQAVLAIISEGIPVVAAAGNDGGDACNVSPASAGGALITVSATNSKDGVPTYSNTGSCVHIFAPGDNITSTWNAPGNSTISLLSGTSVACPHVTGIAAIILGDSPNLTPQQLKTKLIGCASAGRVIGLPLASSAGASTSAFPFPPPNEWFATTDPSLAVRLDSMQRTGKAAENNRLLCQCEYVPPPPKPEPSPPAQSTASTVGTGTGTDFSSTVGSATATPNPKTATTAVPFWFAPTPVPLFGAQTETKSADPIATAARTITSRPLPTPAPTSGSACAFGICINFVQPADGK